MLLFVFSPMARYGLAETQSEASAQSNVQSLDAFDRLKAATEPLRKF